jgi:hypothetical protein
MSFKKNKYTIIKQAISKDLAEYLSNKSTTLVEKQDIYHLLR